MTDNKKALKQESKNNHFSNIIAQNRKYIDELTNQKLFILYNLDKRPLSPFNCNLIDITQEKNFTTLDEALNTWKNLKQAIGIGIVLGETSRGNLCGVDIDNCIDEKGNINHNAQKIIDFFSSYTELSPSKKGIHILFYANKKDLKCKINNLKWCKSLEMYDKNRYFTLTGNCINNSIIQHKQKEADIFYDKYFKNNEIYQDKQNSCRHVKDEEFLKIGLQKDKVLISYFNGARPNKNESADDIGFMAKLMFWTNYNKDLSIKTFINSPYAQQKDKIHQNKMFRKDYLLRTAINCKKLKIMKGDV